MTNEQLNRADTALVSGAHLRNLRVIMQRTDTGAFRDAQNTVFLMIDEAEEPSLCMGPNSASCPGTPA